MPYVQIDLERAPPLEAKRELARELGAIYARVMQIDARIVNVAFRELGAGNIMRLDGAGGEVAPITILSCDVRRGRTAGQRTELGRALAGACASVLGCAEERLIVYITEHDASDIYRDGGAAPAWHSDEARSRQAD